MGSLYKIKKEDGGLADKATCTFFWNPFPILLVKVQAHLEGILKSVISIFIATKTQSKVINSILGESKRAYITWRFDQEYYQKELAIMIIIDGLPFIFSLRKQGFWDLWESKHRFNIVSQTTITKDCVQIYLDKKKKLKSILETLTSLCVTPWVHGLQSKILVTCVSLTFHW